MSELQPVQDDLVIRDAVWTVHRASDRRWQVVRKLSDSKTPMNLEPHVLLFEGSQYAARRVAAALNCWSGQTVIPDAAHVSRAMDTHDAIRRILESM